MGFSQNDKITSHFIVFHLNLFKVTKRRLLNRINMAAIEWPTVVSRWWKMPIAAYVTQLSTLNRIPEEMLYRYVVLFYHELLT